MQLESLNCNNCGAPLEVAATSNFVTCNHCSTRLAVRRTESSAFTEQFEEVIDRLDRIERQHDLAELDRQWESEKAEFNVTDGHGYPQKATYLGAAASGIGGIFCLFWIAIVSSFAPILALFGIIGIVLSLGNAMRIFLKAQSYEKAHDRYLLKRTRIKHGLNGKSTSAG